MIAHTNLLNQFYVAIWPVGGNSDDGAAYDFFKAYLALPIVLLFWAGGYVWKRQGWLKTGDIDVDSGRREVDWQGIHEYKAHVAAQPMWKRVLMTLF